MKKLDYIFLLVIILISCNESKLAENKNHDTIFSDKQIDINVTIGREISGSYQIRKTEKKIFGDTVTKIDPSFSFADAVFDYGASYHLNGCDFNFECDCCSGNLILNKDSTFYYVSHCMGNLTITRGLFTINNNNMIFVSDGIRIDKEYDPSKEYDPNNDEFTLIDSITNPYDITFEIKSCNGNALLIDAEYKDVWIATLTNLKANDEIKKLGRDGILDRFMQRDLKNH